MSKALGSAGDRKCAKLWALSIFASTGRELYTCTYTLCFMIWHGVKWYEAINGVEPEAHVCVLVLIVIILLDTNTIEEGGARCTSEKDPSSVSREDASPKTLGGRRRSENKKKHVALTGAQTQHVVVLCRCDSRTTVYLPSALPHINPAVCRHHQIHDGTSCLSYRAR